MGAWIKMIADKDADSTLMAELENARGKNGTIDNVMRVHSLRPHTMAGHHKLYMSVLHNEGNTLPGWFLEVIASYVSMLNNCDYSLANHFSNARHLIGNDEKADLIYQALKADSPQTYFTAKELATLEYAKKLTSSPASMVQQDVLAMREQGMDDSEILEVNQVCCYFNYVNRTLNGLGVTLAGDTVGFYSKPSDHTEALQS